MNRFRIAALVTFIVTCSNVYGQVNVPMSNWKVRDPGSRSASEVTASDITLHRTRVVWEHVNQEISGISLQIRSMSNLSNDGGINMHVVYDDGLIESIRLTFPGTNTRVSTVTTDLLYGKGRLVKSIELFHGSGVQYHITSFSYTRAAATAVYINQSNLAGARLEPKAARHNDVLVVKGSMSSSDWPYLTNVPSNKMQLVASVTGFTGRDFHQTNYNLSVRIEDTQGSNLRTLRVPLDLVVGVAEVDFSDIDPSLIGRVVFFSGYSGIQFTLRQINFGSPTVAPSLGCPGLMEVNQRFQQLINQWKNEGMMGNRYIQELESILRELQQLE